MPQDPKPNQPLMLTGALTLQAVEAIHASLMRLSDRDHLAIDCRAATEVDLSVVQLILSARTSARQTGRSVTLAYPAEGALLDTLKRGGFLTPGVQKPDAEQDFWLKAGS
ncbi:MAG TPA: STAS domain-containing protein [Rhodopila sp.]|jgi:ABC-type transporter Mla MlaB component|nr:STAS domain-containing protein [Rhodopila sp.]